MAEIMVPSRSRGPVADYNEVNLLETDDVRRSKVEFWIAKQVGEKLVSAYPGREWSVLVDTEGRMLIVCCPSVSLENGYHIAMGPMTIEELCRRAILAAGEILERFSLSRGCVFDSSVLETLDRDPVTDEAISPDAEGGSPLKVKYD